MSSSPTNDSLIDETNDATSSPNSNRPNNSSNMSLLKSSMKDTNNNQNGSNGTVNNSTDWLYEGCMVHVQARTWPGMNKLGGAARVVKVHVGKRCVDVQYVVMGGTEKSISMTYIKPAPELLTRKKVSLRNRSQLLGRCTRCGSLRTDCQSCDWKNQIYTQQQQQQRKATVNTHKKYKKSTDTDPALLFKESSSSSDDSDTFFIKIRRRQKQLLRKKRKKKARKKSTTVILSSSSSSEDNNYGDDDAQFIDWKKMKDIQQRAYHLYHHYHHNLDIGDMHVVAYHLYHHNLDIGDIQQRAYHLYRDYDDNDEFIQPEGTDILLPKDIEDETLPIKNDPEKLKSFFQTKYQLMLHSKLPQMKEKFQQSTHVSESLYLEWQKLLIASGIDQCRIALKRLEDESIDEEIVHHQFDNQLRDLELHVETFLKQTRYKITDNSDCSAESYSTSNSSSVNLTDNDVIYNDSDSSNYVTGIDADEMGTTYHSDNDNHFANNEHNLDRHPHASHIRNKDKPGSILPSPTKRRRNKQHYPKSMQVKRKRTRKHNHVPNENHDDAGRTIQDFLFPYSSSSLLNDGNIQQQTLKCSISDRMQSFLDANTANKDMIYNNNDNDDDDDDKIYSDIESSRPQSFLSQKYKNTTTKNTQSSQKQRRKVKNNRSSTSHDTIHTKTESTKSIYSNIDDHDGPVIFSANNIFSLWKREHGYDTNKDHPSNIRNQGTDNDINTNVIPRAVTMLGRTGTTISNNNNQKNSGLFSQNSQLRHSNDDDHMSLPEEDNLGHLSASQKKNHQEIMNQISCVCQELLDNFFHPRTFQSDNSLFSKLHTTIIQHQHKLDRYAVSALIFSTILELFQDKKIWTRSLLNFYIEEDEKRLLLYTRLIRFTVQMMIQNLHSFLKKEDGHSFEIFNSNKKTMSLFMECILIQIIDVFYFQALPDAWGQSLTKISQRLQRLIWKELSTLCDYIAQTIPIVECVSQIIVEKISVQQWRKNNIHNNEIKWFVSSIDPLAIRDLWIHGKGFPSLAKGKYKLNKYTHLHFIFSL